MAITQISDVVVPEIFTGHAMLATATKSRLIASGAVVRDPVMDGYLAGEGSTFHPRSFRDLDDVEPNISNDSEADKYTGGSNDSKPNKIATLREQAVRMSRNNSWATADLVSDLIADDPQDAIASRVGEYWARSLQKTFIATMHGVFSDNATDPSGADTHSLNDLTNDASGLASTPGNFADGITNFTNAGFIDAVITIGDSMNDLGLLCVHSLTYARMEKNKLLERTVIDPTTGLPIMTYLGRAVIVDDSMPTDGQGKFESWIFGNGAVRLGMGSPKVPTAVDRDEDSGNGGGSEVLYNRIELCMHPSGHRFIGQPTSVGGPSNAKTANNLANGDSWSRAFPERKQIKMARYITREY